MDAYSSDLHTGEPGREALGAHVSGVADSAARRWKALHTAAGAVAGLADLPPEQAPGGVPDFTALLADAPRWRAALANSALEDITAFMQSGLTALLAAHVEDRDPSAAALALWTEFVHARNEVLKLLRNE